MEGSRKAGCPQRVHDDGAFYPSPQPHPALPDDYTTIAMRLYDYQQEREQQLREVDRAMDEFSPPQLVGIYPNDSCNEPAWERRVEGVLVGRWEAPLFGCFTDCVPNCWMVTLCPCLALAQALHRMRVLRYSRGWKALLLLALLEVATIAYETYKSVENGGIDTGTPYFDSDGEYHGRFVIFLTNCYGGAVFMHLVFVVLISLLRAKVRRWFMLPGGWCADCGLALACPCCALAQITTQVKSYTPGNCSLGEPDVLPPFERR
jgi:Cys-rich protein (TIGR01571 family)